MQVIILLVILLMVQLLLLQRILLATGIFSMVGTLLMMAVAMIMQEQCQQPTQLIMLNGKQPPMFTTIRMQRTMTTVPLKILKVEMRQVLTMKIYQHLGQ